jgi:hypothetical protein
MKILIFFLFMTAGTIDCSKQPSAEKKITPPIYVSFDKDGKRLFGPISQDSSLSDGNVPGPDIPGSDNIISVYCSELTHKSATLTFIEYGPKGGPEIRKATHTVPLGLEDHFKIFDSVDVTIKNSLY